MVRGPAGLWAHFECILGDILCFVVNSEMLEGWNGRRTGTLFLGMHVLAVFEARGGAIGTAMITFGPWGCGDLSCFLLFLCQRCLPGCLSASSEGGGALLCLACWACLLLRVRSVQYPPLRLGRAQCCIFYRMSWGDHATWSSPALCGQSAGSFWRACGMCALSDPFTACDQVLALSILLGTSQKKKC